MQAGRCAVELSMDPPVREPDAAQNKLMTDSGEVGGSSAGALGTECKTQLLKLKIEQYCQRTKTVLNMNASRGWSSRLVCRPTNKDQEQPVFRERVRGSPPQTRPLERRMAPIRRIVGGG